MGRVKTVDVEVEVECDDLHCDEATQSNCKMLQKAGVQKPGFTPENMQRAFDQSGPQLDRHTDWWRCQEEPWVSIAREMFPPVGAGLKRSETRNRKISDVNVRANVL